MSSRLLTSAFVACWFAAGLAFAPRLTGQVDSVSTAGYVEDFDVAWTFVRDSYAYFEQKQTDWDRVRLLYRPRAGAVRSKREFIGVLEDMIEELYDPHAHLNVNTRSSPRLVPSGTDVWAEWQEGRPVITDVRAASEAERAGLRPGMEIVSVNGQPVGEVVRQRLPTALRTDDSAAMDWALRAALAGHHDGPLRLAVRTGSRTMAVEFRPGLDTPVHAPLTVELLEGNVGYVRVHDALGDIALIAAWDSALVVLRSTRALILDLRDTPGGGNSTVARGILSRLTAEERPYQRHELPAEEQRYGVRRLWVEYVAPRGPFIYDGPMAVLVGRWTGSMGEGLTIGLDAMQRATVVGTPMAQLRGATGGVALPNTRFEVRIPVERLYHVRGIPREEFIPAVRVQPGHGESGTDAALKAALKVLGIGQALPPSYLTVG